MPLTPKEYAEASPSALGPGTYRRLCRKQGLDPIDGGYGLLLCIDGDGQRVTMVTDDVDFHRVLIDSPPTAHAGQEVPAHVYRIGRSGWPDEW